MSFAFETTLAGRSLAPRVTRLRSVGFVFRLLFLWSPSPELSIQRVASRVRLGGHNIPEATIRRRYEAGLRNFFEIYRPIADSWAVFDTTREALPRLIAEGNIGEAERVADPVTWSRVREGGSRER